MNQGFNVGNINLDIAKHGRKPRKFRGKKSIDETQVEDKLFTGESSIISDDVKVFKNMKLNENINDKPIIVCPDGHIFLETFTPNFKIARHFLNIIANPISTPKYIYEYQINSNTLMNAIQKGLSSNDIIRILSVLSKYQIDVILQDIIRKTCRNYSGNIHLLKTKYFYFVYSNKYSLLQSTKNQLVSFVKEIGNKEDSDELDSNITLFDNFNSLKTKVFGVYNNLEPNMKESEIQVQILQQITPNQSEDYYCFEVSSDKINEVLKYAKQKDIQLIKEYDYLNDLEIESMDFELNDNIILCPYQRDAVTSFFINGFFTSGVVCLPYGGGKTIIGTVIVSKIKKPTLIFCDNIISISQWIDHFKKFTTISDMDLIKFLSNSDNEIPIEPCIVFTTYNYFLANRTPELMKPFTDKKWGLIVFDEIKKGNCDYISTISNKIQCNGKLGLTNFMLDDSLLRLIDSAIGPYLYSKSLKELIDEKYYPNVQCYQVFCKMTHEFMYEYLNNKNILMKRLLAGLNPNKIMTLHRLIRMHEDKGDKIIVYGDILFILKEYSDRLFVDGRRRRPCVTNSTPENERNAYFERFATNPDVNCLFLSRIADKQIEIPPANVFIQICSHLGSKINESQRFERILRPGLKRGEYNAFFYIIVSEDTKEVYYSNKNRQNLIEQGFSYKAVYRYRSHSSLNIKLCCQTKEEQLQLLKTCVKSKNSDQNAGAFEVLEEETIGYLSPKRPLSTFLPSSSSLMKRSEYKSLSQMK